MIHNLLNAKKLSRAFLAALTIALLALAPKAALAEASSGRMIERFVEAGSNELIVSEAVGAVYVLTNQLTGNGVAVFNRYADGSLSEPTIVATGGQGISTGLGSQGAIVLSDDGQWLLAVNAGSDELSLFAVSAEGLELSDKVASGGVRPTSVTIHEDLVYVLNAGASGNITGFWLDDGELTPIAGSTRHVSNLGLGNAPTPAQISFDPKGELLVVTERESNMIATYQVAGDGLAYGPTAQISAGTTPYGFAFTPKGTLVVSEAFGGEDNASAVSSYTVSPEDFTVVSPSVGTEQTAACWIAVSKNGSYAYSANAGSSSISSYRVGHDGSLTLLDGAAGFTGDDTGPVDLNISEDGQFLYVLSARTQNIIGFAVQTDGSLELVGTFEGLPRGTGGIAVY